METKESKVVEPELSGFDQAVKARKLDVVNMLLCKTGFMSWSSVRLAAENRDIDMLKLFAEQDNLVSAFKIAIENNEFAFLVELTRITKRKSKLVVCDAIKQGNLEFVKFLHLNGFDMMESINTALEFNKRAILDYLLSANINCSYTVYPICAAIRSRNLEMVKYAIAREKDMKSLGIGDTLDTALEIGAFDIAEFLIANGHKSRGPYESIKQDNMEVYDWVMKKRLYDPEEMKDAIMKYSAFCPKIYKRVFDDNL